MIASANTSAHAANPALLRLVAQAFEAQAALDAGGSFGEIADRLGYGREYLADLIRTSYLTPAIITAIVEGRQPTGLTRKQLLEASRVPLGWDDQVRFFGIG